MHRYTCLAACAAAACVLMSASCSSGGNVIKIGSINAITGEAASYGASTKNGAALAFKEANASGGVLGKKIQVIYGDDKGDPSEGAVVYTKLIQQDRVAAIVGTTTSRSALAGAPICQEAGVPMITPTGTSEKVTAVGDFIFRGCFIDSFQGRIAAKYAAADLGRKTAGIIFDVGNDYSRGLAETFTSTFEENGGRVIVSEGHPSGAVDFKAQLTKIVQASPEIVYIPDYYNDVGLIAKQARELGYKGQFAGGDGWDSPELAKIGGDAVEGGIFTNHYSKDDTRPVVQQFVAKYKAEYGSEPDAFAVLAYDSANILIDAIKRAGSTDGAKIRDALASTRLDCITGTISYDENRNPVKAAVIVQIKGGAQSYCATVNP